MFKLHKGFATRSLPAHRPTSKGEPNKSITTESTTRESVKDYANGEQDHTL
jgi:hypothetical protein